MNLALTILAWLAVCWFGAITGVILAGLILVAITHAQIWLRERRRAKARAGKERT